MFYADMVGETCNSPGIATFGLAGAMAARRTFVAAGAAGKTVYYSAISAFDWEVGYGTVTDATPDTLTRNVIASSNANALVNFTGDVEIELVSPARVQVDAEGAAPVFGCRAWVVFNGTGTPSILASGNIASITDNGLGDYTINFTTAMPDVNYVVTGSAAVNSVTDETGFYIKLDRPSTYKLTTSFRVLTGFVNEATKGFYDFDQVMIQVVR